MIFKSIDRLINKKQKIDFLKLGIMLFIAMFFEAIGLFMIIPIVSLVMDPNLIYEILDSIVFLKSLKFFSRKELTFLILIGFGLVYTLKTLYFLFLTYFQNKILNNFSLEFTNDLLKKYLHQEYLYHLNKDTSNYIKNIHIESANLKSYILSLLNILIETGVLVSIFITLLIIEPFGAISTVIFFLFFGFLYNYMTKNQLKKLGQTRILLDKKLMNLLLESFRDLKSNIIYKSQDFFLKQHYLKRKQRMNIETKFAILVQSPRYFLELISVIGIIILMILFTLLNYNSSELITSLTLFVSAAFRVLPSANKILNSFQNIKYFKGTVDMLNQLFFDLTTSRIKDYKKFKFKSSIQIKDLGFSFNNKNVFEALNFEILKEDKILIKGGSGSGKSTLINILLGFLKNYDGQIILDKNQKIDCLKNIFDEIGYMNQETVLIDDTIKNNIIFGREVNENKLLNAIESSGINQILYKKNINLNTLVGENGKNFSGGEKQRISLARAMYGNPEILILDEATSALDFKTEKKIIELIRKNFNDKIIIFISHNLAAFEFCNKKIEII